MFHETLERVVERIARGGPPGDPGPGVAVFELLSATLSLVLGLVVGTAAFALSGGYLQDEDGLPTAFVTALVGALVAGLVGWLIDPALLAVVLAVVAWLAVVRVQYGGDWTDAVAVGLGAWLVAVVLAAVLALFGLDVSVVGVPGV